MKLLRKTIRKLILESIDWNQMGTKKMEEKSGKSYQEWLAIADKAYDAWMNAEEGMQEKAIEQSLEAQGIPEEYWYAIKDFIRNN